MQRFSRAGWLAPILLLVLLAVQACNKTTESTTASPGASGGPGGPGSGPAGVGGPERPRSAIGEVMIRLTKGEQSLNAMVGKELNEEAPPWDKIQPRTHEVVQLTRSLSQYDPPRGSKESWEKQTASFSKLAADLDKAAQAKDKDAARAAHQELTHSCKGCHETHRMRGPRRGGPGPGGPGGPPMPPPSPPPQR